MDSEGQVTRRATRAAVAAVILILVAGCGRSNAFVTAPPPAADPPAAVQKKPLTPQDETRLALDLLARKEYEQAIAALRTAAAADPIIAPYLDLRIAEADEALDRIPQAIATTSAIITAAPASSAATVARLRLPALYAAIGDVANMDATLHEIASVPVDDLNEADFVALANALDKCGFADRATAVRMRILRENADGRYTEPVYTAVAEAKPSPLDALTTEEATTLAATLARANHYDQALDLLQRIATRPDAPSSTLYRNVRLHALYNSRNYTQLLDETANTQLDAPLQLMRARAAWRLNRDPEFLAGLEHVESEFPKSPQAVEAKLLRAKYYSSDEIDLQKSIDNLRAALDAGALGTDGESLWTLGYTYVLAGRYDDALHTFEQYLREYPDGSYAANALFWTGKVEEKLGNKDARDAAWAKLISDWPYDYYSYRAKDLGAKTVDGGPGTGDRFPDVDAELAQVSDPRIAAVRELDAVGLDRDATREMKAVAAAYRDNRGVEFMLAEVYAQGGEPFEAIGIVQRYFRDFLRHGGVNIPQRLWQIVYPLQYWDDIRTEAQKRNIDPYLVASIIRQESGFEPTVVSNAGAVGLMQIMPAEASIIGVRAGIGNVTREQLFDPSTNIAVGTAEYSQKLADMHGDPILAVAAYNAGEEPVGRWLAQTPNGGDPDLDMFVESIPYAETRLYVKSVMRNRNEYRRVYESSIAVTEKTITNRSSPSRQ